MKKLLICVGTAAALCLAACGDGKNAKTESGLDSLFTQAQTDSLIISLGQAQGFQNNSKFARAMEQDSTLSKEKFLQGLRYVLNADTTTSFAYGMYTAFNMLSQFNQWESQGLKVNRTAFYSNFSKAFMAESVNDYEMNAAQTEVQSLYNKLTEAEKTLEKAKLENSEEALANVARGRQYVDSLLAADPEFKATASGVAVKVLNPGEGDQIKDTDVASLQYTAKTLDGRTFDRAEGESVRPIRVASRPNGLQEGLSKLGKGGKAVIVVPGKEAYGVDKGRRYGLGLNETVVYEVEVLDVMPQN